MSLPCLSAWAGPCCIEAMSSMVKYSYLQLVPIFVGDISYSRIDCCTFAACAVVLSVVALLRHSLARLGTLNA